ncbi:Glycosyltransferase [Methanosarcina sp. Kolksee]|uniref:glycosyltransferase family 4 protein n=1 Tax=Methanosarcina sp. Kolksee TaxID=1434099 RepID=UPI000615AC5A|nr:glycosyltransferase family 4 protein [Methanosarcina sp. Kolksee]AKB46556.1 Glycosyltransferase [Methanosarcina sp. Kolksee]
MKILYISGRERSYTRNAVILKGLKDNDIEIIECTDESRSYSSRYFKVMLKFLKNYDKKFDLIFVGFFGQPLVPIIKKFSNKPIVFDAFLSAYDTMCFDRKQFSPKSVAGKFFYWLDQHSCELANKVLLDSDAHINYFVNIFGLDRKKFERLFVGADDSVFYPVLGSECFTEKCNIFYYGSYLPLQGIEYIIKAAKKLQSYEEIKFKIVGNGMEKKKILKLAQELNIINVEFVNWIPYEKLPMEIAKADICLGGHFSDIDKSKKVIAGKTFQFIAMKKPVIVGDNPANRELFENRQNALLVEHANSDALVNAILDLKKDLDLRSKIAEEGYRTFCEKCTSTMIGKQIADSVKNLL